jgi:hypothetical protein
LIGKYAMSKRTTLYSTYTPCQGWFYRDRITELKIREVQFVQRESKATWQWSKCVKTKLKQST